MGMRRVAFVELPLREADLSDLLELPVEELLGEHAAARLQAVNVRHPALDGVVLHDLRGPLAELHRALVLDLEADGDDGLKAVVLDVVGLPVGSSC